MKFKNIKLEFFYWRKVLFEYRQFFKYIKNKYFLAKKILESDPKSSGLEKPINNQDLSTHLLTCHKDLIMLIWSLASFYKVINMVGELYIHSDGSLNNQDERILKKFFPSARITEPQEFLEKHKNELEKYPAIKKFRTEYPEYALLKKLIDPYFVSDKKYIWIIDSDLLWFKQPIEIENEIKSDCQNSLMMGFGEQNSQPNPTYFNVYFKDGSRIEPSLANFNSGIVLYKKENFNLEKLSEYLERIDINNDLNRHFIEQAGYAYCLENLRPLLLEKYIIKDKVNENTVVKHYTSPRRPLFYLEGLEILKNKTA